MIAAQHERQAALLEDAERRLVQALADARDVSNVFLTWIPFVLRFGDRRDEIAGVDDRNAQRRQPLAEPGDAERGWSHVDSAAIASEIERDAHDVDGFRHRLTRPITS